MALVVTQPPTVFPVTLAEAKTHLRVRTTSEDNYISSLVEVAHRYVWSYTGQIWGEGEVKEYLDAFPECCTIELTAAPVGALVDFEYKNTAGTLTEVDAAVYAFDEISVPARIVRKEGQSWPETQKVPNAVAITYTVGMEPDDVPATIKQAMLLYIGFLYENREDIPVNETNNPRIRSVDNLLNPHRLWRI